MDRVRERRPTVPLHFLVEAVRSGIDALAARGRPYALDETANGTKVRPPAIAFSNPAHEDERGHSEFIELMSIRTLLAAPSRHGTSPQADDVGLS
jgi:hypothetical protein